MCGFFSRHQGKAQHPGLTGGVQFTSGTLLSPFTVSMRATHKIPTRESRTYIHFSVRPLGLAPPFSFSFSLSLGTKHLSVIRPNPILTFTIPRLPEIPTHTITHPSLALILPCNLQPPTPSSSPTPFARPSSSAFLFSLILKHVPPLLGVFRAADSGPV